MANISEYLERILTARYGKDVRQSIHDGIDAINKEVAADKEEVVASKQAAAEYAQAAKDAAASAENSADTASTKASEASKSANAANTSESNAKISETNASQSASAASASETNAAGSASSASASEATATQKAAEASDYADQAKESAETANTHASTASTKASAASSSADTATAKATEASEAAARAESYAAGGTGTRENEDVDNAQYYYEQAKRISQGMNGLIPMGTITFADLSNTDNQVSKYMFNISDAFTTDDTFKGGAGNYYGAGTNVYRTEDGYWDCLAGTAVTGVKGAKENTYRQGNVDITPENVGAVAIGGDTASNTVTFTSEDALDSEEEPLAWSAVDLLASGEKHSSFLNKISTMFKNIRYLYKLLGATDISDIGDGTVTGGLKTVNSNLTSKNYILERSGSNDYKVSFKWEKGDDEVFSLVGYINDVAVFRIRQNFDAQILDKTVYTFTADSTNLKDGSVQVIKQGNFLHFKVAIALNPNTLDSWTNLKIGTLSNWVGISYNVPCLLSSIGPSPKTLGIYIDTDGTVSIRTHNQYASGLGSGWYYGFSTQYISS